MNTIDCPKCEHEHEPCGSHEDDSGQWECESCGWKFNVKIDYEPEYSTCCVEHEWGEFEHHPAVSGGTFECRFCVHCCACQLREEHKTLGDES